MADWVSGVVKSTLNRSTLPLRQEAARAIRDPLTGLVRNGADALMDGVSEATGLPRAGQRGGSDNGWAMPRVDPRFGLLQVQNPAANSLATMVSGRMTDAAKQVAGQDPLIVMRHLDQVAEGGVLRRGSRGLTQDMKDTLLAVNFGKATGANSEQAGLAVQAYRQNPRLTSDELKQAMAGNGPQFEQGFFSGLVDGFKRGWRQSSGIGAAAVETARRTVENVKPTVDDLAKRVEARQLTSGEAQDLINAGLVTLPDPKTIGRQKPAPVEDRSVRAEQPAAAATVSSPAPAEAAKPAEVKTDMPSASQPKQEPPAMPLASEPAKPAMPLASEQKVEPPAMPLATNGGKPLSAADPAIKTDVKPTDSFQTAAAPASAPAEVKPNVKPEGTSPTFAIDQMIEDANKSSNPGRLETLMKVRAQVAGLTPKP